MIVVKLMGGLGNQMFQYAAGRRLSYLLDVDLKLDLNGFPDPNNRKFSLGCFNIDIRKASKSEIEDLKYQRATIFHKLLGRHPKLKQTYIQERTIDFCSEILHLTDGVYLDGYWQSEKYFKDTESVIRKDFIIKFPLTGKNYELSQVMKSTNSVGVHVRRGDYVSNSKTNEFHGVCSKDYYFKGLEHLAGHTNELYLFVFSDDLEWVKKNMRFPYKVKYICNNKNDYEDLRLMTHCRHNIIANSSFSWWGAWLNENSAKKVIAPKYWFPLLPYNDQDRLPEDWIRINNR